MTHIVLNFDGINEIVGFLFHFVSYLALIGKPVYISVLLYLVRTIQTVFLFAVTNKY